MQINIDTKPIEKYQKFLADKLPKQFDDVNKSFVNNYAFQLKQNAIDIIVRNTNIKRPNFLKFLGRAMYIDKATSINKIAIFGVKPYWGNNRNQFNRHILYRMEYGLNMAQADRTGHIKKHVIIDVIKHNGIKRSVLRNALNYIGVDLKTGRQWAMAVYKARKLGKKYLITPHAVYQVPKTKGAKLVFKYAVFNAAAMKPTAQPWVKSAINKTNKDIPKLYKNAWNYRLYGLK